MPEEPKPQPQLDETVSARAYEPPKAVPCGLADAALCLGLPGIAACFFGVAANARSGPFLALLLIGLACGFGAIALGSVAMVKIGRSGGRLTGMGWAGAGFAAGLLILIMPLGMRAAANHFQRQRQGTKRASCKNCLRQIGLACQAYAGENGGSFPPDLAALFPKYTDTAKVFSCSSNPSQWSAFAATGKFTRDSTSYVYVAGLRADEPGQCVLAFDRPGNHGGDGQNVLCVDGSAQWIKAPPRGKPDELKEMVEKTRAAVKKRGGEIRLVGE